MNHVKNHERPDIESLLSKDEVYRIKKKNHYDTIGNEREISSDSNGFEKLLIKPQELPENSLEIIWPKDQKTEKTIEKARKYGKTEKFTKNDEKNQEKPLKTPEKIGFSCLMNLISNSKTKPKSTEIDLFEDEPKVSDNYKNIELENYWVFLKNNMGNKNILVIPIEDDEEKQKEDLGLWRYPLENLTKLNEIYQKNQGKPMKNKGNREKFVMNRIKWNNCFSMEIPNSCQKALDFPERPPKFFHLN